MANDAEPFDIKITLHVARFGDQTEKKYFMRLFTRWYQ